MEFQSGRRMRSQINYRSLAGMKTNAPCLKECYSSAKGKKRKLNEKKSLGIGSDLLETCLSKSGIKCQKKKNLKNSPHEILHYEGIVNRSCTPQKADPSLPLSSDSSTLKEVITIQSSDLLHSRRINELKMDSYLSESDGEMSGIHERRKIFICRSVEDIDKFTLREPFDPKYTCDICGKKYTTNSILRSHKIRHWRKSALPFSCSMCDFRAASKLELNRHSTKHKRQHFNCPFCSKIFLRETSVNEHVKMSHVMNFTLECSKCGFRTCKRSSMRNHILNHDGPMYSCPICGAFFNYKNNLQVHMRCHADVRAHGCDECGKNFFKSNDLSAHIQQVHKPKIYECNICKKKFSTVHHLKRHFLTHTCEKPFSCCFCIFASNTHGNLLKHIRSIHGKLNFTYKDVLKAKGEFKNPKDVLPLHKLQTLDEKGYHVAEEELKKVQRMGGTKLNVASLQKEFQAKEEVKVASIKAKNLRKTRAKTLKITKEEPHKSSKKDFLEHCVFKTNYESAHPEILCSISHNFCVPLEHESKRGRESENVLNVNSLESDFLDTAIDYDSGQENTYSNRILPPDLEVDTPEIGGEFIIEELQSVHEQSMTLVDQQAVPGLSKPCNPIIIIDQGGMSTEIDSMHLYKVTPIKNSDLPIFTPLENPSREIASEETESPLVLSRSNDNIFVIRIITGNLQSLEATNLDASVIETSFEDLPNEVMLFVDERDFSG